MHMSFLVLRSRRCLVEIFRVIDRYRICRFFPSYSSGSSVSSRPIICHRQDFFPCINRPIASSIRQRLRFSRSSPTSLRRLMLEITRCSACLIFRQRLIPSTTTCWSSAWRGRMVFVRLRLTGSVLCILDRRQSVFYDGVSSSVRCLVCRFPQGSVLGPLLFLLHTADVDGLAASLGF